MVHEQMNNLIFSLNATIPVFFVIFLGWFLFKIKILNSDFDKATNKIIYNILFPVLLFRDISSMNFKKDFDFRFVLFCFFVTLICMLSIWGLTVLFLKEKDKVGSFVQGSFRGSAAILGISIANNLYGSSGMVPMMIVATVPFYNIFTVILLTIHSNSKTKQKLTPTLLLMELIKNPMIIGISLGLPFSLLNVQIPELVTKSINNIAVLTTPLALLVVGAGFDFSEVKKRLTLSFIASTIKLIIQPIIFIPFAVYWGFRNQELIAILIMLGAPTTVSSYIMSKNMNNDYSLSSAIVVETTLFSVLTITAFIFIFRSLNLI